MRRRVCVCVCVCACGSDWAGRGFLWEASTARLITTSTHTLSLHLLLWSVVTQKLHMGQITHWSLHSTLTERRRAQIRHYSVLFFPQENNSCLSSPPSFLFCICFPLHPLSLSLPTQPVSLSYRARLKSPKNRQICSHTFIFIASISHCLPEDGYKASGCLCCHLVSINEITRSCRASGSRWGVPGSLLCHVGGGLMSLFLL